MNAMQVAAKIPQMMGESAETRVEPEVFARARPRLVQSSEGSAGASDEKSEEETRAGLQRLAKLIRDKRREMDPLQVKKENKEAALALVPKAAAEAPALTEIRAETDSYHLISFIFHWQEREKARKKSMAAVFAQEFFRRRALAIYKRAAHKEKPAEIVVAEELTS